MSRNINTGNRHYIPSAENKNDNTGSGKLIVTEFENQHMVLLFRQNRLLAVSVFGGAEEKESSIGAIYIGKVKKLVKNIGACFVEIREGELCYLPLSDCKTPYLLNRCFDGRILEGDELLVQVIRDAIKTKQAAVTTKITLSSPLLVMTAGNPKAAVSGKLSEKRKEELLCLLHDSGILDSKGRVMQEEGIPSFGIILRTESANAEGEVLLEAYQQLRERFMQIFQNARYRTCFSCMSEAISPLKAAMEQIYPEEYQEIITDIPEVYEELVAYIQKEQNHPEIPIRLYKDESYSLSKLYSVKTRLKEALDSKVWLKSGGYLVIEPTEALTVIDVNSGKYDASAAQNAAEETFYQINLEAAKEIAIQLRLRNLSGIIVIDFINMKSSERQEELLKYLRQLTCNDRLKTNVVDITPLGLVELTRQKRNRTLRESLRKAGKELAFH